MSGVFYDKYHIRKSVFYDILHKILLDWCTFIMYICTIINQ